MRNDFTKEELEEIQEIARHCSKQGVETRHNLTWDVKLKAERMIDNYCEHEPEGDYHVCVDKCKHCGVIINE